MKSKIVKIIFIVLIICSLVGVSFAYFRPTIMGTGKHNFAVSANLEVTFNDVDTLTLKNNKPIYENDYKYKADYIDFSITGQNNTIEGCYTLYISVKEMTPNLKSEYFKWVLYDLNKDKILVSGDFSDYDNSDLQISYIMDLKRTTNDNYRLYIFIANDEEENQTSLLNSSFSATVKAVSNNVCLFPLMERMLLANDVTSGHIIDFSYTSNGCNTSSSCTAGTVDSNIQVTNGLYKTSENTEDLNGDDKGEEVYFYRGIVENNYVVFGKYLKALKKFRGYSSSTSTDYSDYDTLQECNSATLNNYGCSEVVLASIGSPMCWRIVRTVEDGSIRLRYGGVATMVGDTYTCPQTRDTTHIGVSVYFNSHDSADYVNYKTSIVKTVVENWYRDNIAPSESLTNLISDTPYCNDMSARIVDNTNVVYGTYDRLNPSGKNFYNPQYKCENSNYAYTVAKGDLTYPVGLLTADEMAYAGGVFSLVNPNFYLNIGKFYWGMSPSTFTSSGGVNFYTTSTGYIGSNVVTSRISVVPVISLKNEATVKRGTGLYNDPYVIFAD